MHCRLSEYWLPVGRSTPIDRLVSLYVMSVSLPVVVSAISVFHKMLQPFLFGIQSTVLALSGSSIRRFYIDHAHNQRLLSCEIRSRSLHISHSVIYVKWITVWAAMRLKNTELNSVQK